MTEEPLTTQQVADRLGIGYRAALKRLLRAQLKPLRVIGRSNLWSPDVVDKIRAGPRRDRVDETV